MHLILPWPPSTNRLWRSVNGVVMLSHKARQYRNTVALQCILYKKEKLKGDIVLHVDAFPPDKRKRDLDNLLKPLIDSLNHANIFDDDFQICQLSITRKEVRKNGHLSVIIRSKNDLSQTA